MRDTSLRPSEHTRTSDVRKGLRASAKTPHAGRLPGHEPAPNLSCQMLYECGYASPKAEELPRLSLTPKHPRFSTGSHDTRDTLRMQALEHLDFTFYFR
jgi:hypothetical protein